MKKYKLIEEYPGSPRVGIIAETCYHTGNYICKGFDFHGNPITKKIDSLYVENYPKFWQEIIEYPIGTRVSNKNSGNNIIKEKDGYWYALHRTAYTDYSISICKNLIVINN